MGCLRRDFEGGRGLLSSSAGCLLFFLGILLSPDVGAQQPEASADRAGVMGVVYDIVTGTALPGAVISLEGGRNAVVSDHRGIFEMEEVETGPQLLVISQFGYEKRAVATTVTGAPAMVEVPLTPRPIMLEGVTAVAENVTEMEKRIRFRRRAADMSARAYDRAELARALAGTPLDFLRQRTLVRLVPCPPGVMNTRCVWRRGRAIDPRVFVDEIPAFGGLDELDSYAISDMYLMEVYSWGTQIRMYTHQFMERMARRPMMLIPLNLWTRPAR